MFALVTENKIVDIIGYNFQYYVMYYVTVKETLY